MLRLDCMFVSFDLGIDSTKAKSVKTDQISYRCYSLDFLMETSKSAVFSNEYSLKTNTEFFKLANQSEDKSIPSINPTEQFKYKEKVVRAIQSLILANKLTFLKNIKMLNSEPSYRLQDEMSNYFAMHDTDFAKDVSLDYEKKAIHLVELNEENYDHYAEQFK